MDLSCPPIAPLCRFGDALLIATADGSSALVHAIDANSGMLRWQCDFMNVSIASLETCPISENQRTLLASSSTDLLRGEGAVVALDQKGTICWRWASGGRKVSALAIVGNRGYATLDTKTLVMLDLSTGVERQRFDLTTSTSLCAPLIVNEVAYVPCRGPQLLAVGLDGRQRWSFMLMPPNDAWLDKTPMVIGTQIFVVSSRGEVITLDRDTGALQWRVAVGSSRKPLSQPATNGKLLFVGARDGLYALTLSDGKIVWSLQTERRIDASPVVVDDIVYAPCHDHLLYALRAQTGERLWDFTAAHRLELSPILSPDRATLYIVDQAGTLYAVSRPFTADEFAQAGRWLEAIASYAASQQPLQQAEALICYARKLESEQQLDRAAVIWEQAATLFTQLDLPQRVQTCQHEARRCWQRPELSVLLSYTGLYPNHYSTLDFNITNNGYGPAHKLIIHAKGDQIKGEVMQSREIISLPAGHTHSERLDVCPLYSGHVPVLIRMEYTDSHGEVYSLKQKIHIDVAQPNELRRGSRIADLFQEFKQQSLSHLEASIVSICKADGDIVGTGFLTIDRLLLTCAHVIQAAGSKPDNNVLVRFHINSEEQFAQVKSDFWCAPEKEDVAVLHLDGNLPAGVIPLNLGSAEGCDGHSFRSFGYPPIGQVQGVWATGKIEGLVREQGHSLIQLTSQNLAQGISGAPVLDETQQKVIGMVTAVYHADATLKHRDTGFATPTEALWEVCPELRRLTSQDQ